MIDQIFSWSTLLTVVGLAGFYLAGKKIWWCWYINIACQGLWFTYAIVSDQYGFVLGAIIYTFVFGNNAISWTKEHRLEVERVPQPIGHVTKMIENSEELSLEFKIDNAQFTEGMRQIQKASLTGISLFGPAPRKKKWWRRR